MPTLHLAPKAERLTESNIHDRLAVVLHRSQFRAKIANAPDLLKNPPCETDSELLFIFNGDWFRSEPAREN